MKKGVRLWVMLTLILVGFSLIAVTSLYLLMTHQATQQIQQKEEKSLLAVGKQLAIEPTTKTALKENVPNKTLERYTTQVTKLHGFDFIVLINMQSIRLTHPDSTKIGQHFTGGDEQAALNGKTYISTGVGTLGRSLRCFVPVFSAGKQVGVVTLGIKMTSLGTLINQSKNNYVFALFISILLSIVVALIVSYYLKKQLHSLEPKEISRLLEERNAMLTETLDSIIVIDRSQKITLANKSAAKFYQQMTNQQNQLIGQPLNQIIVNPNALDMNKRSEQFYQQNGQDYFISIAPIMVKRKKVGDIIFITNTTETLFLADQLQNSTSYVSDLQEQTHDFMNRIHIIYGLVDLGRYSELKGYLTSILQPEQALTRRLSILIKDPTIAGFLVSERQRFLARQIQLQIEIIPEITKNSRPNDVITLLNIFRYLHQCFLRQQLPTEINLQIKNTGQHMLICYSMISTKLLLNSLQNDLSLPFFKQLLNDLTGKVSWQNQGNWLQLEILVRYGV